MLYSIIPPIIIILCLTGIIMLLVKKSKQVAQMPPDELAEKEILPEAGIGGKIKNKVRSIRGEDIKQFSLGILERITRRTRVIFLKLESRFGSWSTKIRNQRREKVEKRMETPAVVREDDIIKKIRDYKKSEEDLFPNEKAPEFRKIEIDREKSDAPKKENWKGKFFTKKSITPEPVKNFIDDDDEKEIKPIISERVATPRHKTEMRDRLEELLIERIALNPKDIEAYERLGEYYLEIKSYADSKECFKQVLKLNPQDRNAKYRMRRLENLLAKE
jgi:hypothetical protein